MGDQREPRCGKGLRLIMKHSKILSLSLLAWGLILGCQEKSNDNQEPSGSAGVSATAGSASIPSMPDAGGAGGAADEETVRKGQRGSSCNSTNDCEDGLSCMVTSGCPTGVACANKSCQPSNFEDLTGTGKTCHIKDCATKADCCGEKPLKAPEKCQNRDSICKLSTLPGCTTSLTCTTSATCGMGKCEGYCSASTATKCTTATDCVANTCVTTTTGSTTTHTCSLTGYDCTSTACTTNTCTALRCNCTNPEYAPTSAICSDPDCLNFCSFTCTNDRCVTDTSCTSDIQCTTTTPYCSDGKCNQCRTSDDCKDEECIAGRCGPACKADTQCALFETCQSGKCVYVGCQSDRECVLQARAANATPTQDPRLAKCNIEKNVGTCVFPCEIDAQCATTEVCHEGVCKYIGCATDSECTTIAGLHNQPAPTPDRPWTTKAVCEAEDSAAP